MKNLIVISDFDGVVVEENVASMVFEKFGCLVHQEFSKIREAGILDYEDTLTACIKYIKATPKELNDFALSHMTAREGLGQFKNFCDEYEIPLFIVSEGLDFYIKLFLENEEWKNVEVYTPILVHNGYNNYDVKFPSKPFSKANFIEQLKNKFSGKSIVFIGSDCPQDIDAALCSDTIFAKKRLSKIMLERKLPFYYFENFYDVEYRLTELVG